MARMGWTRRATLAAAVALVGASCTLVAPLNGLSGATDAGGVEAAAGDVGPADAAVDDHPPDVAAEGADAPVDAPSGAEGQADAPPEAVGDGGPSPYVAAVLADTPLAYWRLDESAGSTVCHDASGHGNDAAVVGAVTLGVTGALAHDADTAGHFDGKTGQLDVGDKFDFVGLAPASIELWLKAEVIDTGYRHVETKMLYTDAGQPDDGMYIYIHAGQTLGFERWNANTTQNAVASPLTANAWTHVVGTFDGSAMALYVNGVQVQTGGTSVAMVANGVHMLWGQSFQGTLDELALYDHALSAARVQAHFLAEQ
jgi:hypothetical protein